MSANRRVVTVDGRVITFDASVLERARDELARQSGPDPDPVRFVAAAAHLVMTPAYRARATGPHDALRGDALLPFVDFDATLAIRRRLAAHGFAIAEAMDTAQRFEIGWPVARELIRRTGEARLPHGFVAGAGVDSCPDPSDRDGAITSICDQAREIRGAGGIPIVLPIPELAKSRAAPDEYVATYRAILARVEGPVFLHWLGPMFLPELAGYFPGDSFPRILDVECDKIRGAKLSLLDADFERRIRAEMLARDQIVLTGDDHHFASLIAEDGAPPSRFTTIAGRRVALGAFSHGLLGIFDAIAAPAGLALRFLARGDRTRYHELMAPLERLGQAIFEAPTQHYKAGLAFLAWLDGHQSDFQLVNHAESRRDRDHYLRVATLAGTCGAIEHPSTAADRIAAL